MNKKNVQAAEYRNVTDVVARYVEAVRTGDIDMLIEPFHKDAVTYGTVDGALVGGASNPGVDFIKRYGKSPDLEFHIDVLDMTPTTAVVRIVTEKDAIGADCIEYQTLVKLDSGWTIMAKFFHQFDM